MRDEIKARNRALNGLGGVMMKRSRLGACMVLIGAWTLSAPAIGLAKQKMDKALSARLANYLRGKKAGVLLEEGLPGDALGSSYRNSVGVKIEDGGAWEQKKFLGVKLNPDSSLPKGELLSLHKTKVKKDGLEIETNTVEALLCVESSKSGSPEMIDYQGLDLDFRFGEQYMADTQENCDFIVGAVEKYVKLFDATEDAMEFARSLRSGEVGSDDAAPATRDGSLAAQLREVMGPSHYTAPKAIQHLKWGMSCKQVKKRHPGLDASQCKTEGFSFLKVGVANHPLLAGFEFTFKDGGLTEVKMVFKRGFKKAEFRDASSKVLVEKWGRKKASDMAKDLVTWSWTDAGYGQRSYHTDRWVIHYQFAERGEQMFATAPIKDADSLTRRLAAFLGPSHRWTPTDFTELRKNMSCEAVRNVLSGIESGDCPVEESDFVKLDVKGDPLVARYDLFFSHGRLKEVNVIFQRYLDKRLFHDVSNRVFQAKWGQKTKSDMAEPSVSWFSPKLADSARRTHIVDHWELHFSPVEM
jgi:hypothetical protein